jgi:Holliday junction resolvasome RuvABC endonuclease subunit
MNRDRDRFVWAIDPAVSRVAFAFASLENGTIHVETLNTHSDTTEGERLGLLDRQVRIFARQRAGEFPANVVWVEQPSRRFRNLPLTYSVGVVQAALSETLAVPICTIASSAWKARTVGTGNASKAQVAAWVAARGADLPSQDECDAYCIAAAGRAMLLAGSWGAAASA